MSVPQVRASLAQTQFRNSGLPFVAIAAALLACACTGEPSEEDIAAEVNSDEIAERVQRLSFFANPAVLCTAQPNGTPQYWAAGDTVNLCFTGPDAMNVALVSVIQSTINDTWGRAANLNLSWRGTCPVSIDATWVSIYPSTTSPFGIGAPGRRNRLTPTVSTQCDATAWSQRSDVQMVVHNGDLAWAAAHEFGHVLGFSHEHDRTDNHLASGVAPNCPDSEKNPGLIGSAEWLSYYDPVSVMNYCGVIPYGRVLGDPTLSPYDILGAEMFYPRSLNNHKIACVDQCFAYGDGGAIVRSTGTITSNWKARGASSLIMRWTSTSGTRNSEFAQASLLPANASTFTYSFTDVRGRANTGSAPLVNSNAAHAAIITQL